jgi:hypothetical protein
LLRSHRFASHRRPALSIAVLWPSLIRQLVLEPANIPLEAHPEGFQLASSGNKIFVNLPDARRIAVVDRLAGKLSASWVIEDARANFPMAIDEDAQRVLVAFRSPAKLAAFGIGDGSRVAKADICSDANDVFADSKRHRVYVSCGDGFIDVFEAQGTGYDRIGHIPTAWGARTSLLVPKLDRFFLVVRATSSEPASLWIFRPTP